jgi:lipopolysaccharide transport system ATP-binding protein
MLNKEVVLSVHNISKKYYYKNDQLNNKQQASNSFWALENISFELHKGEILGIIGENGAGKSTLLKILSEIIEPTEGYAKYETSILSILDIGTGFHSDLSGYENIFLNASLLGMKKKETLTKVDEIIDFSGIREFINEPVKNYSNGMYLRLALSIALFTSNGIILLDEVISVGDAEFRMKAVKKILEQANLGRACIMISHDINSISQLCNTCLLLEKGKAVYFGTPSIAIQHYYSSVYNKVDKEEYKKEENKICEIISVEFEKPTYYTDEPIHLNIKFKVKQNSEIGIAMQIINYTTKIMTDSLAFRPDYKVSTYTIGEYITTCQIPSNLLNAGSYLINVVLANEEVIFIEAKMAAKLSIVHRAWEQNKNWYMSSELYPIRALCEWQTRRIE